jgi:pimeloyl-ACP methyl ester carboxylesterase
MNATKSAPGPNIELYATDGTRLSGRYRPAKHRRLGYVIAHGFTGSSATPDIERIAQRLSGRGAGVLAMDFRGHGRSGGETSIGVTEVLDVAAAVAYLRAQSYEQVCTAGWSMGASVVLRHAALNAGVDAVISVSGPGLWYERSTRPMRILHLGAETAPGRRIVARVLRTRIALDSWQDLPESPVELAHLVVPTPLLIVHGDRDPYFPLKHARALHAAAAGSTLWVEPGMGHAESATSAELVDRLDAWTRRVLAPALQPAEFLRR